MVSVVQLVRISDCESEDTDSNSVRYPSHKPTWCNSSMRVSKTFGAGANPAVGVV